MSIIETDIFRDEVTPLVKKKYHVKPWRLYIQSIYLPIKSRKNIASASLFLYPERAEKGQLDEYKGRVNEYLTGIKKSLDFIRAIGLSADWAYRLYLDFSIVKGKRHHPNEEVRNIAQGMIDTMEAYKEEYGEEIEIMAVRSETEQSTFLASLWRFLPLFDERVDRMLCSEADNPFNSLYLHIAETFWKKHDKYMMISPDMYGPPHCLIRVAMDIESPSANLCFIAQNWGAKKLKNEKTIEDVSLFTKLLQALDNEDTITMWSNALNILAMRTIIVKSIAQRLDIKQILYTKSWDAMKKIMIENVQQASESIAKENIAPKIRHLFILATENRKVAGFIAMMIFPAIIQPYITVARSVRKYYIKNFMIPIVLNKGYGIDEWLLHLMYDIVQNRGVSLVRSNSFEYGLTIGQSQWLQSADNGNTLKLMNDLVSDFDPPFGEYVARTIFFLRAISPANESNIFYIFKKIKNDYFNRLFLLSEESFSAAKIDFNMAYKLFDSLYHNDNFERQAQKKAVFISDIKKFNAWTKAVNVSYDHKNKRFQYRNKQGFFAVKEVFLKGLFCEIKFMHLFKFCNNVNAQLIPW